MNTKQLDNNQVLIISSPFVAGFLLLLLSTTGFSSATETDIACLRSIKSSLEDPHKYMASWDFSNLTEGDICRFAGIMCWHVDENKVFSIKLTDMGLQGKFPCGIKNCSSITGLDLSNNDLTGEIPSDISEIAGFLTTLDLSSNAFTGTIPKSLVNCTFLNILNLNNNRLSGEIPPEIGLLGRLTQFSVANNLLSGPVPRFTNSTATAETYANNAELCGGPLKSCQPPRLGLGLVRMARRGDCLDLEEGNDSCINEQ